jgi:hypothetical protein
MLAYERQRSERVKHAEIEYLRTIRDDGHVGIVFSGGSAGASVGL